MKINITVIGTGYVGLVTGAALASAGHHVTCLDNNYEKISKLQLGASPFYEPGLEDLMKENTDANRLFFTTKYKDAIENADLVYIAVGTAQNSDGSVDLSSVRAVAKEIVKYSTKEVIVVLKSTVPVGTNEDLLNFFKENSNAKISVVSNPEFLREGSAIHDTFHGDRIVIGSSDSEALSVLEHVYQAFNIPIVKTDFRSAELIKYASNAFLATKISFINEIATVCEKLGANVEDVAGGMGMDARIGASFLQAGIGYGGSCFPKDTNALMQIAGNVEHPFTLLESVINVNNEQPERLIQKAIKRFGDLKNKQVSVLGLSFKPNTDDMREAPSLVIINKLLSLGAIVRAYDPVALDTARKVLPKSVELCTTIEDSLVETDMVFILTEWRQIKEFPLTLFPKLMKKAVIFDGRNCFRLQEIDKYCIEYHSIGRRVAGCCD